MDFVSGCTGVRTLNLVNGTGALRIEKLENIEELNIDADAGFTNVSCNATLIHSLTVRGPRHLETLELPQLVATDKVEINGAPRLTRLNVRLLKSVSKQFTLKDVPQLNGVQFSSHTAEGSGIGIGRFDAILSNVSYRAALGFFGSALEGVGHVDFSNSDTVMEIHYNLSDARSVSIKAGGNTTFNVYARDPNNDHRGIPPMETLMLSGVRNVYLVDPPSSGNSYDLVAAARPVDNVTLVNNPSMKKAFLPFDVGYHLTIRDNPQLETIRTLNVSMPSKGDAFKGDTSLRILNNPKLRLNATAFFKPDNDTGIETGISSNFAWYTLSSSYTNLTGYFDNEFLYV